MICPDRQILSVYLDGELPSPWKEKMETHLALCRECRERLESYRLISRRLKTPVTTAPAQERVWLNIAGSGTPDAAVPPPALPFEKRGAPFRRTPGVSALWRRTVSLPLPAAAALTAAAAAFVIVLASAWLRQPVTAPQPQNPAIAAGIDLDLQSMVPVSDMNGVLQYLGDTDAGDIVILRLPESRNFRSSGEPTIIKAADYYGGSHSR